MTYLLAQASAHAIPLADESVQCVVTSPPYWGLRDYAGEQIIPEWSGALGLEPTPQLYVEHMVEVMREVRRVLRKDGTLWLNLGDSYASGTGRNDTDDKNLARRSAAFGTGTGAGTGPRTFSAMKRPDDMKPKDLVGIPWMVAFALRADGWWLRSDIIWAKPNPMPESVTDRPTKAHEYVFLLTKRERYFYDADAIREASVTVGDRHYANSMGAVRSADPRDSRTSGAEGHYSPEAGRNARSVWTIATKPYPGAHFATFPPELPEKCIKAGTKPGDVVLDPFNGSGTTGRVALSLGRSYVGLDLSREYLTEQSLARIDPITATRRAGKQGTLTL